MENAHTSYEDLLTPSVLDAVRPYAEKLAKRTRGGLEATDLIHEAIAVMLQQKRVAHVQSMEKFLSRRVRFVYLMWVTGGNTRRNERLGREPVPFAAPQDRYMATGTLPIYDGVKQLTVPDPSESWGLPLDIERAIHTLNAEEQQFIDLRYKQEVEMRDIAKQYGISVRTLERRHLVILAKLRAVLPGYA